MSHVREKFRRRPRAVFEAIEDGMGGGRMMSLIAPKMIDEDFGAGIEARLPYQGRGHRS